MEAEARLILTQACLPASPVSLKEIQDWVDEVYGDRKPTNVVEQLIQERRQEAQREG